MTTGINTGALKLYHIENGVTVPMTQVANPVNHNEFSYDPATGDVTLALASFSEVAVVADTNNPWDGTTVNYTWYNNSDSVLTIYNADQLAGFGAIVDGTAEGIAQDSFAGKIYVEMYGVGAPTLEEYTACANAGIGTFVCMHATPEVVEGLRKLNKCNLVIAGHMASDSLGFNQILDAWEAKGIEIVRISGIV